MFYVLYNDAGSITVESYHTEQIARTIGEQVFVNAIYLNQEELTKIILNSTSLTDEQKHTLSKEVQQKAPD